MNQLTKKKISLLLNDIYFKSKQNQTFKPSEIIAKYSLGQQLSPILIRYGYTKFIDRGKYIYIGDEITEATINEVYQYYFEYRKSKKQNRKNSKEKDNKQQVKFLNDTDLIDMLFKRCDELNKKVNELEKAIHRLYEELHVRDLNRLHENKLREKKSFFAKLFF